MGKLVKTALLGLVIYLTLESTTYYGLFIRKYIYGQLHRLSTTGNLLNALNLHISKRGHDQFELNDEGALFYDTIRLVNTPEPYMTKDAYKTAYNGFLQAWKAYNITTKAGLMPTVSLFAILDFLQFSALKSGNYHEALEINRYAMDLKEIVPDFATREFFMIRALHAENDAYMNRAAQARSDADRDIPLLSLIPGDEMALYRSAERFLGANHVRYAYKLFNESWRILNGSKALGKASDLNELDLLEKLHITAGKIEEYYLALSHVYQLMARPETTEGALEALKNWEKYYKEQAVLTELKVKGVKLDTAPLDEQLETAKALENIRQYDLCRDEFASIREAHLAKNPKLICRFDNRGRHPLLIYAPLKEEVINLSPVAVIFHDLIKSNVIEKMTNYTEDKLKQAATIDHSTGGNQVFYNQRRSRNAWMASYRLKELTRYLEAVTGMDTYDGDACEEYQVNKYGIGGHYGPHPDFMDPTVDPNTGDRIATLLLYLNEPKSGGGTVFTTLRMRVMPEIGAGLFWYNMFRNETPDYRTYHAGCPVLEGDKWVVNKWFRFRGQFLHKTCGKSQNDNFKLDDFIMPQWMRLKPVNFQTPGRVRLGWS